jgi:hypothetical protein
MLTENLLLGMWPQGNSQIPNLIETLVAATPAVFTAYNLDSDLAVAHAMAQFKVECGGGAEMTEKTGYSAARA